MAAADVDVTPFGVHWPLHQALGGLPRADLDALESIFGNLGLEPNREMGVHSIEVAGSWDSAVELGLVEIEGFGLLARWRVTDARLIPWRRSLMAVPPEVARILRQVGKRWATTSETVLKNVDTAAASWSPTSRGASADPTLRHPPLAALR